MRVKKPWFSKLIIEVCLDCSQSATMSLCAVINCNKKNKIIREASYFQLTKITSVHKDWIHATGCQVDNVLSKISACSDHLKKSASTLTGNFKMKCTIYKDFQISRRPLLGLITTYYLIQRTTNLAHLQRREHWLKNYINKVVINEKIWWENIYSVSFEKHFGGNVFQ